MLFLSNGSLSPPDSNLPKLALPYLTKRCLKLYSGGLQSFGKGLGVLNIFRDLCFRISHFQVTVAYKTVVYNKCVFETDPA